MIEGLKLTFSGEELRLLLTCRVRDHQRHAEWWRAEESRQPKEGDEEDVVLPEHMCAHEIERHTWRADVLAFIRDHIDVTATYRLGEADVLFGELLPPKPGSLEQSEYEERTSVGFELSRLVKAIGSSASQTWRPAFMERQPLP